MEELWGFETGLRAEPSPLAADLASWTLEGRRLDVMLFLHR